MQSKFLFIGLFVLPVISCSEEKKEIKKKDPEITKEMKEDLIVTNKEWFIQEQANIDNYINRRQWKMEKTGTGIRYIIYKAADTVNNPAALPGQVAVVNFEVRLLENDSLCYESHDNSQWFLIEMDNVENGLHEAIQYLRKGDKAKIILPSYLAHGLAGDFDKIPPMSPVLYDIELVELTSKEEIRKREYNQK
jgi:FKBP-type peptidyl-prolyl cis-trans isomerase